MTEVEIVVVGNLSEDSSVSTDEEPTPSDLEFIELEDLKWNSDEYVPTTETEDCVSDEQDLSDNEDLLSA
jgi:hypothetical protein